MKKRHFLLTLAAGTGALIVGWSVLPARQRLQASSPLSLQAGQISVNGWIRLSADGTVGLVMPRTEMGQGAHTGLAMLVAEELDCSMAQIRIDPSPIDKIYGNVIGLAEGVPFHPDDHGVIARSTRWTMVKFMREMGFMMTGGSASIKDLWTPLREASAMTRASLVNALAVHWQVSAETIAVTNGFFTATGDKKLSLGDVVKLLATQIQPAQRYTLKASSQYQLLGKATPRIDSIAKVTARAGFGIDTLRPGMLYAAVTMSPQLGGSVREIDSAAAEAMPGVKKIVRFNGSQDAAGGVAVIAAHYWQAKKALEKVNTKWNQSTTTGLSSTQIMKDLTQAAKTDNGFTFYQTGNLQNALKTAKKKISAEYSAPYLAHATLEPMNCTIEFKDGKAEVWVSTQTPDFARSAAAKVLGIAPEAVTVHVAFAGGGFGRRLEIDFIAAAASIAKSLPGHAIQMIWSREEDVRHDFYRPAAVAQFTAGFDDKGNLLAWDNVSAGQNIVPGYMARNANLPIAGPDKTSSEGAFDQPYELPNSRVRHVAVELAIPVGFWRAVGHSQQAFFKESFIDECAHASNKDPYQFRAELLKQHPRHKAVLDLAASKAKWSEPLPPLADGTKRARGIALHESFGTIVVQIAEVSVGKDLAIRVDKVVCALDCGFAVNPNLIAQQMESAIVFGLSAALFGKIDIDDGQVKQSNFHDYPLLRFNQSPVVETYIVSSSASPEGIGEPGLPPIAPAVANAVFALTGQRLRNLPLSLMANS